MIRPDDASLAAAADVLNAASAVTILAGAGCAGAHDQLMTFAVALQAPIVHAFRGKEFVEYDNPCDVGMTGLIGFGSGYRAMEHCDALVMLGTDFPYRSFLPDDVPVIQVDVRGEQIGHRIPVQVPLAGTVGGTLDALLPLITAKDDSAHLDRMIAHYGRARARLDKLARDRSNDSPLHPQYVAATVDQLAADDAIFTVDVGTPCIWVARYVRMNGTRGWSARSTTGPWPTRCRTPSARRPVTRGGRSSRCPAMAARDAARRAHHAAPAAPAGQGRGLQQRRPRVRGTGDEGGRDPHLRHRPGQSRLRRDRAGHRAVRRPVDKAGDLEDALRAAFAHDGPALVDVHTVREELSLPPNITYDQIKGFTLYATRTILSGSGEELVELAKTNLRQLEARISEKCTSPQPGTCMSTRVRNRGNRDIVPVRTGAVPRLRTRCAAGKGGPPRPVS